MNQSVVRIVRAVAAIVAFAVCFFVLQRVTFTLRFPPYDRTTIWIPGSLTFAALMLSPYRHWWRYYVGLCLGAALGYAGDSSISAGAALVAAQLHFSTVALGVLGLRRLTEKEFFSDLNYLLMFWLLAGVIVPFATTLPLDILRWSRGQPDIVSVSIRSALCASLGLTIAVPAIVLTISSTRTWIHRLRWWLVVELFALACTLLVVTHLVFTQPADTALPFLMYVPVPLLLWIALRFGLAGTCWALLAVAYQSTWGAINDLGPFSGGQIADKVLQLQLFLLTMSLPLMLLATLIKQRQMALQELVSKQEQLRSQFAQLKTIYQSVPIGLGFVDTNLNFVSVNDSLAQINGRSVQEHLSKSVREVLPNLADKLEPVYRHVIETGVPILGKEIRGQAGTRSEESEWAISHYPVKDSRGDILGVSTVVEEITLRKRADRLREELLAASRLALLGELSASIAHEINQPLGAIFSNADAADMLLASNPQPGVELRAILADIRRDIRRASDVVRRIRKMVKSKEQEFIPVDINALVEETLALVISEATGRNISIHYVPDADTAVVLGDRIYVQQALLNLLMNAMEAIAENCSKREIVVKTFHEEGYAGISVADTGAGFGGADASRLFENFFSTKVEGVGLGLAISKNFIESHGGKIWAEENQGAGATFHIRIPGIETTNQGFF